jgi:hypothetical protein
MSIIDQKSNMTIILYNFELHNCKKYITFEELDKLCTPKSELIGYDMASVSSDTFEYIDKLLKNVKHMY